MAGLDSARRFREPLELGMQPTPAAITLARQRLGWQVIAALLEETAGPLAGEDQRSAFVAGIRLVAVDGMCLDLPDNGRRGGVRSPVTTAAPPVPADPRRRPGRVPDPGGARRGDLAAGHRGAAAGRPVAAQAPARDLLLGDRNFLSHGLLADVLATGAHVLWRAKATSTCRFWR